ncbi:hypothetical protein KBX06_21840 [Micromonospora sp. C31]|uniref:hypothetical protein n=1 Tax=Micromonospora sp. C31 TaxID=2824876 RepID=UPI001B384A3E|nr:hypothetical protein [Micromonospora sp. C31]MBQ1075779.1 hypothetical protein [Micromonospora sp. C31]
MADPVPYAPGPEPTRHRLGAVLDPTAGATARQYLRDALADFENLPTGSRYHLWFVRDPGAVAGGGPAGPDWTWRPPGPAFLR